MELRVVHQPERRSKKRRQNGAGGEQEARTAQRKGKREGKDQSSDNGGLHSRSLLQTMAETLHNTTQL